VSNIAAAILFRFGLANDPCCCLEYRAQRKSPILIVSIIIHGDAFKCPPLSTYSVKRHISEGCNRLRTRSCPGAEL
uniref:Chemokine interleukin-8-like domain-containing protein n=2 Tax=Oncorhynchus TaxID=8016 RepID=A0A8C7KW97_ONCKI